MWQSRRTEAKVGVQEEAKHGLDVGTCVLPLCLIPHVCVCGGGEVMMKGAQERMVNSEAMSWGWTLKIPASGHPKNIS